MHHQIIYYELNNARIADLHRHAERDRLGGASAQARRARRESRREYGKDLAGGAVGGFARRLLVVLGARSA
jgi:hypothetical protein